MLEKLKRKLKRLNAQKEEMEARHKGNEQKFTYHGGFDLGYLKGKIAGIEDAIDEFEDIKENLIDGKE